MRRSISFSFAYIDLKLLNAASFLFWPQFRRLGYAVSALKICGNRTSTSFIYLFVPVDLERDVEATPRIDVECYVCSRCVQVSARFVYLFIYILFVDLFIYLLTYIFEASPSEGVLSTLGPKITLLHNINFQTICFINVH